MILEVLLSIIIKLQFAFSSLDMSWEISHLLEVHKLHTDIGELCLEVVGQYVEWIDINLVSFIFQN